MKMTSRQINAAIISNEHLGNDIHRISMDAPEVAELAQPGQFVMLKASKENGAPLLRRPLSIHQASSKGLLQILFKRLGPGTSFLASRRTGEKLSVLGPLGKGFSVPASSEPTCIIGGGIGVAPLFYLAQKAIQQSSDLKKIKVLLGAATAGEINTIADEFKELGVEVYT